MVRPVSQVFDEVLVLYAIEGRQDAFEHLARRWRPRHYAHARRFLGRSDLAADAVQDAWVSIVRTLWRLHDPTRFPAWSYAIVTRRCQDSLRQVSLTKMSQLDETIADTSTREIDGAHDISRGLTALPPDQRAAIALFYLEGFTVAEISEALLIPEGTVKTRLFHARRTLRQYFEGECDE